MNELVKSFVDGHRETEQAWAHATKGTVTGPGLTNVIDSTVEGSRLDLPTYALHHTVTEHDVAIALLNSLAGGECTQAELIEEAVLLSCRQYYVPIHVFVGGYKTRWSAAVGFDRIEYYQDTKRIYENGVWHDRLVTKSNLLTDWHPMRGEDAGTFHFHTTCGSNLPAEVMAWIDSHKDFASFAEVSSGQVARMDCDRQTSSPDNAFHARVASQVNAQVEQGVRANLQGDRVRDCQWSYELAKGSTVAYVPLCHMTYQYKDSVRNFWVDGRNIHRTFGDPLPIDETLKSKTGAAALPAMLFTIGLVIAAIYFSSSLTAWKITAGVIALFISWGYSGAKVNKLTEGAKEIRKEKLAARLASVEGKFSNECALHDKFDFDGSTTTAADFPGVPPADLQGFFHGEDAQNDEFNVDDATSVNSTERKIPTPAVESNELVSPKFGNLRKRKAA